MNKLQSVMLSLSIAFGLSAAVIAAPGVRLQTELVKMQEEILREGQYINHQATDARRLFRRWKQYNKLVVFNRLVLAYKLINEQAMVAKTQEEIQELVKIDKELAQEIQKNSSGCLDNATLRDRRDYHKKINTDFIANGSYISGFSLFYNVLKCVNDQTVKNTPYTALYKYSRVLKVNSVEFFQKLMLQTRSSRQIKEQLDKGFAVENDIWSNLAKIQHSESLDALLEKKRQQEPLAPVLNSLKNNKNTVAADKASSVIQEKASDETEVITPARPELSVPQLNVFKRLWNWGWNKVEQHPKAVATGVGIVLAGTGLAYGVSTGAITLPDYYAPTGNCDGMLEDCEGQFQQDEQQLTINPEPQKSDIKPSDNENNIPAEMQEYDDMLSMRFDRGETQSEPVQKVVESIEPAISTEGYCSIADRLTSSVGNSTLIQDQENSFVPTVPKNIDAGDQALQNFYRWQRIAASFGY